MDRRLRGRRRDYVELVRILDQGELLNSSFGNTYELTRPVMPGADLCTPEADSLCVSSQGRRTPLSICMDGRAISSARPELEVLDPRGLFLVEAFSRVGWIDMYSRGYVAWLIETGQRLSPVFLRVRWDGARFSSDWGCCSVFLGSGCCSGR